MPEDMRQLAIVYKQCFATEQGQRVLAHLKSVCFFSRQTEVIDTPGMTSFNNGKRDVILWIMQKLEVDLDKPEEEQAQTEKEII